jgi:hypothetical protein
MERIPSVISPATRRLSLQDFSDFPNLSSRCPLAAPRQDAPRNFIVCDCFGRIVSLDIGQISGKENDRGANKRRGISTNIKRSHQWNLHRVPFRELDRDIDDVLCGFDGCYIVYFRFLWESRILQT